MSNSYSKILELDQALSIFGGYKNIVVEFFDCGYIFIDDEEFKDRPSENDAIESFGTDIDSFINRIGECRERRWRPYIVTEYVNERNGSHTLMKLNTPDKKRRMPLLTIFKIMSNFVSVLKYMHSKNFYYLDHKPSHIYWDTSTEQLKIIDFNVGRFFDNKQPADALRDQVIEEELKYLIKSLLFTLLVGEYYESATEYDNSLRKAAQRDELVVLPPEYAKVQKIFDKLSANKLHSIDDVADVLDEIMADYGLERPGFEVHPDYIRAYELLNNYMDKLKNILALLEKFQTDIFDDAMKNVEIPEHIKWEIFALYQHVDVIRNSGYLSIEPKINTDMENLSE